MNRPFTSIPSVLGYRAIMALTTLAVATMFIANLVSAGTTVTNIVMTPSSPAALQYGTHIDVTFDYETDVPGGAWIGFLPQTEGSWTPGFAHSGGPFYPVGSGSGTFWFTVSSGPIVVDEVQVEIADTTLTVLDSFILPATFAFVEVGSVTNIVMAPATPATVNLGEQVLVTFDYEVPEAAQIDFQPFSSGAYTAGGQHVIHWVNTAGTGSGSGWFTVTGTPIEVDAVQVRMVCLVDQTQRFDFLIPVSFTFDQTTLVLPSTWGRMKTNYSTLSP